MAQDIDHIATVEEKVRLLQSQLQDAAAELQALKSQKNATLNGNAQVDTMDGLMPKLRMSLDEYGRYGRQMIMPEVGIHGQLRLRSRSALIVGAGGLGCPAAAYLAGAGVGTIGIVDGDTVETSNLHRQILHSDRTVGSYKSDSIADYIHGLNPNVTTHPYRHPLTPANAIELVSKYDLVLDCTDMPASRYLVSDACVLTSKPLVSGSALRTDGQLMLLNSPPAPPGNLLGGPCYRCIWPTPPPPDSVMSCGEAGILGPVVGTVGTLMALEALKLLAREDMCSTLSINCFSHDGEGKPATGSTANLLIFSAFSPQPFRSIRLRGRRADCKACSAKAVIQRRSLESGLLDYERFCGRRSPVDLLTSEERILPVEFADRLLDERPLTLDVREKADWEVFHLPGSINIPWSDLSALEANATVRSSVDMLQLTASNQPIVTICRLGNDSQLAVKLLQRLGFGKDGQRRIAHVEGGWARWRRDVPGSWPDY